MFRQLGQAFLNQIAHFSGRRVRYPIVRVDSWKHAALAESRENVKT